MGLKSKNTKGKHHWGLKSDQNGIEIWLRSSGTGRVTGWPVKIRPKWDWNIVVKHSKELKQLKSDQNGIEMLVVTLPMHIT